MNFTRLSCSLFGFISLSLSITSFMVIGVVQVNHLYAGANFLSIYVGKSLK